MDEVEPASEGALHTRLESLQSIVRTPWLGRCHSNMCVIESIVEDDDIGASASFELFDEQYQLLRCCVAFVPVIGDNYTRAPFPAQAARQVRGQRGPVGHTGSVDRRPTKN